MRWGKEKIHLLPVVGSTNGNNCARPFQNGVGVGQSAHAQWYICTKRVQEWLARVPSTEFVRYIMDEVDSMSIIRHLEEVEADTQLRPGHCMF